MFWPKFGSRLLFVGFTSTRCYILLQAIIHAISRTNTEANLRTWQKPSFGPDLSLLAQVWAKKKFFVDFTTRDIVANYHCMQLQEKLMNQT